MPWHRVLLIRRARKPLSHLLRAGTQVLLGTQAPSRRPHPTAQCRKQLVTIVHGEGDQHPPLKWVQCNMGWQTVGGNDRKTVKTLVFFLKDCPTCSQVMGKAVGLVSFLSELNPAGYDTSRFVSAPPSTAKPNTENEHLVQC